jgi:streptogramin lyase
MLTAEIRHAGSCDFFHTTTPMKLRHLIPAAAATLLLAACQQPSSHVFYGTRSPFSISRVAVTGGTPSRVIPRIATSSLAIHRSAGVIYADDKNSIHRWTLGGKPLGGFSLPNGTSALALDESHGQVYWADIATDAILRRDLNGQHRTVVIRRVHNVGALAFDGKRQALYWSRWEQGADPTPGIWRANADGSGVLQVAKEESVPEAIAVDQHGGQIYWTSQATNGGRIVRANPDGKQRKVVLGNLPGSLAGLAIDPVAKRIFWSERYTYNARPARIRSVSYDGKDVRTVQTFAGIKNAGPIALGRLPRGTK